MAYSPILWGRINGNGNAGSAFSDGPGALLLLAPVGEQAAQGVPGSNCDTYAGNVHFVVGLSILTSCISYSHNTLCYCGSIGKYSEAEAGVSSGRVDGEMAGKKSCLPGVTFVSGARR